MPSSFGFLIAFLAVSITVFSVKANFGSDFEVVAGGTGRAAVVDGGEEIHLKMDKESGSGVSSKSKFLFGKFEVGMKLVPGYSAGTVATFYLASKPQRQDEIDMEFLGNVRGDLYVLQTNIFTQGKGDREQRFRLWFDPTQGFHTYTILWNPLNIIMYVDDVPIRHFKRNDSLGVGYVEKQPLNVEASLWNGEDWATEGGTIKIDWSKAPFVASYRGYNASACAWSDSGSRSSCGNDASSWMSRGMGAREARKMEWAKKKYMTYDYCDKGSSDESIRRECSREFS